MLLNAASSFFCNIFSPFLNFKQFVTHFLCFMVGCGWRCLLAKGNTNVCTVKKKCEKIKILTLARLLLNTVRRRSALTNYDITIITHCHWTVQAWALGHGSAVVPDAQRCSVMSRLQPKSWCSVLSGARPTSYSTDLKIPSDQVFGRMEAMEVEGLLFHPFYIFYSGTFWSRGQCDTDWIRVIALL